MKAPGFGRPGLSLVFPVFDEERNLEELIRIAT